MNITISLNENTAAKLVETMAKALCCITANSKESEETQQILSLQKANAALQEKLNLLQKQLANLETKSNSSPAAKSVAPSGQVTEQVKPQAQQAHTEQSQVQSQAEQEGMAIKPDEEKAEQWVRENIAQWLDVPCPFGKAGKRTWKQLAQNEGEKIVVRGSAAVPRAYLHSLASWPECNVWSKLKAKVALEIGKNGNGNGNGTHSHYSYPVAVGS